MRTCVRLVAAFVLVASTATAQTTTEDGIRALIRGDYQAAARILRPLGEESPQPDPVAQFFMAILYDTGQGVARNGPRACGLFLSAATPANPFMQQSSAISNLLREGYGPLGSQLCVSGSKWRDVPPTTFTLAPDHRIVIADGSITVTYNGQVHAGPHRRGVRQCVRRESQADATDCADGARWWMGRLTERRGVILEFTAPCGASEQPRRTRETAEWPSAGCRVRL
jgi:hypothetical protein